VARAVVVTALITGATALDEYIPLLARETGASASGTPLLVLTVSAGAAAGGWLAGRGTRWAAPVLAAGAGCLAVGALLAAAHHEAGILLVAAAFGTFFWAIAHAEARLQDRIQDGARATVTSVAGFGSEVVAVAVYGGYALGSAWAGPGALLACAALPFLLVAPALGSRAESGARGAPGARDAAGG
jgi:hypothetical protein